MGYGDFSQSELLKYLATHKAACNECGKTALEIQLEVNHIDHNKENDAYQNIEILCVNCHRKREGRDTKIRDMV